MPDDFGCHARMGRPPTPLVERFWSKVDKAGECWLWTGATNSAGYGHIRPGGSSGDVPAHRAAWFLHTGEWPPADLMVCHHCDTPACVRFEHLFLGTQGDNQRDASAKGRCLAQANPERMARGERNGNSRLTREVVLAMRRRHAQGRSIAAVAREYAVATTTAKKAITGMTWAWL